MNKFEKCTFDNCENIAKWIYMPGWGDGSSPYICDDHVHRGCSCNVESIKEDYPNSPEGIEGVDWEWIKKDDEKISFEISEEKTYWRYIDEKGRPYPCCEYENSENGFYTKEYEDFLQSECDKIGYDILSDEEEKKWFDKFGHILWSDNLILKIEKIINKK
jgi:hypothetical protein